MSPEDQVEPLGLGGPLVVVCSKHVAPVGLHGLVPKALGNYVGLIYLSSADDVTLRRAAGVRETAI